MTMMMILMMLGRVQDFAMPAPALDAYLSVCLSILAVCLSVTWHAWHSGLLSGVVLSGAVSCAMCLLVWGVVWFSSCLSPKHTVLACNYVFLYVCLLACLSVCLTVCVCLLTCPSASQIYCNPPPPHPHTLARLPSHLPLPPILSLLEEV